ncbi:MAG: methyltransferase [Frankiales bacterium]|nr:methyltransferase [Frankiales bacterium]
MTPEQARLLLSDRGREAVALASSLDLSPAARIRAAEAVRPLGDVGPLALEQALLRVRARAKHPRGDVLWWTPEALEQASSHEVASSRADRFDRPVLDLGCSVGGDLLTLPAGSTGVDLDEARLLLAQENARVLGRRVSLVRADVRTLTVPLHADVFADPARRSGGRRTFDPRAYSPPLDLLLGLPVRSLGVKVAPGIDHEALPASLEVEVVSLRGDVKEAVLWGGAARRGARRTATLLPGPHVLVDDDAPVPRVAPPGAWLMEPDGAVVRAHLVAQVARDVDGWLLDATIAYVAADAPVAVPWGRWYRVLEVLPFSLKGLKERLRAHDAGPLVVKKRGTAVEPEVLRRQLKLTGSREVTVVLTRSAGRQVALVVEPTPSA